MDLSRTLFLFLRDHKGLPFRTMTFFNGLLEATLCGALMILLLLLVRRFLRPRLGSRLVYCAWALVALRLLLPLSLPNPLMNGLRPTLSTDTAARPVADQIRVRVQDAAGSLTWPYRMEPQYPGLPPRDGNGALIVPEDTYTPADLIYDLGVYTSYGWTGKWVFFGYLAVCGGVVVYMVCRNGAFRRGLRRGRVCLLPSQYGPRYQELCRQHGVKPLPVWFVDPLPCACLVGVLRPYIALPLTVQEGDLPAVLAHELCHYKARDHWWALVRNLCCMVHWFNPLVWLGARLSRFDCELACDQRVAAAMDSQQRIAYANTLVISAMRRNAPRLTVLATGMSLNGKRLKKRIAAILQSQRVRRGALAAFAAAACVVTLCAFATGESRPLDGLSRETAIYQYLLDDPFYRAEELFSDQEGVRLAVGPVTSGPEAAQQAIGYFQAGLLSQAPFRARAMKGSAYHAPEGWYVFGVMEENQAFQMLLGEDGRLLSYERCLLEEEPLENQGSLPSNMEECVLSYFSQFAWNCYGETADGCQLLQDAYDREGRYLWGTVTISGRECSFKLRVAPDVELLAFDDGASASPSIQTTQKNVLASLWAYQQDQLGLSRENMKNTEMAVGWEEAAQGWLGEMTLHAELLPPAALELLEQRYGQQSSYLLQMRFDLDGTETQPVTLAAQSQAPALAASQQSSSAPEAGGMPQVPVAQTQQATIGGTAFTLRQKDPEDFPGVTTPPGDAMPAGQALQITLEAIGAKYGAAPEELARYLVEYGYQVEENPYFSTPYWQIDFMDAEVGCVYEAIIHAPTGQVQRLSGPSEGNG